MTFKYIYIYIYTYIHKYTHINPQGIGLVIFKASWDPSSRKKKKRKRKIRREKALWDPKFLGVKLLPSILGTLQSDSSIKIALK